MQNRVISLPGTSIPRWIIVLVIILIPVPFATYAIVIRHRQSEPVDWGVIGAFVLANVVIALWAARGATFARLKIDEDSIQFARHGILGTSTSKLSRGRLESLRLRFVQNFGVAECTEVVARMKDGTDNVLWQGSDSPSQTKLLDAVRELREALGVPVNIVVRDTGYPGQPERDWELPPELSYSPLTRVASFLLAWLPWVTGFAAPFVSREPATIAIIGVAVLGCGAIALHRIIRALRLLAAQQEGLGIHFGLWIFMSPLYYAVAAIISYSVLAK